MKFFVPILVLIILTASSCGYHRIRYTKVVQQTSEHRPSTDREHPIAKGFIDGEQIKESIEVEGIGEEEPTILESTEILSVELLAKDAAPSDTLEAQDDIPDNVVYLAVEAEKRARNAKALFIAGTVSILIISYLALIATFVGLWFYIKSNRSRFITERGEAQLRKAKIALIVNLAVVLLLTLLIVALIFL